MSFMLAVTFAGPLASASHAPPPLTPLTALTRWHLDPTALAVLALAGALYLTGARRVRQAGGVWPVGRTIAFCLGGIGLGVIATSSSLAVYWPVLFYMRAGQTVLLLLGVPVFAMMGRPLTLFIAASPRFGQRVQAAASGKAARLLSFPAITAGLLVVTPFVLYFSPWYAAGLSSFAVRELTTAVLVLPGLLFFWTLLRFDPVPRAYPYAVALWVSVIEVVGDGLLGLAVIADRGLIAGSYYHALARPWGTGLRFDQILGGGVLWIVGDIIGLPFLVVMLLAMIHDDESEARRIDAELDARQFPAATPLSPRDVAEVAGAGTGSPPKSAGEPGTAGESGTALTTSDQAGAGQRPWWESDPRFTGRFASVDPEQS